MALYSSSQMIVFWRADTRSWVGKYKAPDGEWRQKRCPEDIPKNAKRQAEAWFEEWAKTGVEQSALHKRGYSIPAEQAFQEFLTAAYQSTRAPSTVKGYKDQHKNHIKSFIEGKSIQQVIDHTDELRKWYRDVRDKRGLSASRARNIFSTMRKYVDNAIFSKRGRGANPFDSSEMISELPPQKRGEPECCELAVVQLVISSPHVPLARATKYMVAFTSGLREGELCGLTWADVEGDWIRVRKARRLERAKGETTGKTKTDTSIRDVPLHPAAKSALEEWRVKVAFYLGRPPVSTDPVWPSERNGAVGEFARPAAAKLIKKDWKACKLPHAGMKMKTTRSTFGTWLERAGIDDPTRKRFMGHGGLGVTQEHYTAPDIAKFRAAIRTIKLVWLGGVDREVVQPLVHEMVQGRTKGVRKSLKLKAPPARVEHATNGLGIPGSWCCDITRKVRDAAKRALLSSPTNGYGTCNGIAHHEILVRAPRRTKAKRGGPRARA